MERGSKRREGNEPSQVPSTCLPVCGGTIRGMGEKFAAHSFTGTGSTRVRNAGSPGHSLV